MKTFFVNLERKTLRNKFLSHFCFHIVSRLVKFSNLFLKEELAKRVSEMPLGEIYSFLSWKCNPWEVNFIYRSLNSLPRRAAGGHSLSPKQYEHNFVSIFDLFRLTNMPMAVWRRWCASSFRQQKSQQHFWKQIFKTYFSFKLSTAQIFF